VALGHVPGTALPGQTGNVGIAGHRDTLFRCLRKISKNDRIVIQTTHGNYTYFVERTNIVKPQDVGVLVSATGSEITLITCYPFRYIGSAPDRFFVKGRVSIPPTSRIETATTPQKSENIKRGLKCICLLRTGIGQTQNYLHSNCRGADTLVCSAETLLGATGREEFRPSSLKAALRHLP
jgi:LPXTG-site transpeptidase (sortase) family protein